jgi:hypothetical protein
MTRSTSDVAVCCSSASVRSRVRARGPFAQDRRSFAFNELAPLGFSLGQPAALQQRPHQLGVVDLDPQHLKAAPFTAPLRALSFGGRAAAGHRHRNTTMANSTAAVTNASRCPASPRPAPRSGSCSSYGARQMCAAGDTH